jgi:AraC-like DNA-binding protein
MPVSPRSPSQSWLESPLQTEIGELQLAGVLQNAPGIDPRSMRVLGSYALVLIVAGKGYYRDARGTRCDLVPGDTVVVFPDVPHAYGPAGTEGWTQVYFVFAGPQFDLWRRRGVLRPEHPVLRVGAAPYWRERLAHVLEGDPQGRRGGGLRALGRFVEIVAELIAADEEARSPGRDRWLERSLMLLGHRTAQGWFAPQEVAREVGLTYESFRKRFVQLSGESPGQYQRRRRLDWARAAIYQGDRSMKQIADELGFCDVFHFSKAFKQVVGTTPSEYRRRVRGG